MAHFTAWWPTLELEGVKGMGQNISTKRRFHFHPSTSSDDDFLKRRFLREMKLFRFVSSRAGNSEATPRPANLHPFTYTHAPTRTFNRYPRISLCGGMRQKFQTQPDLVQSPLGVEI